ncbi:uncharacterized protein A1O9_04746 [Exophiala aquamarina CBS 119918]|uniref:Uncharacterized protein n=1 Tax=Exophiala aquamarina CBS 119918 TaxID=1182545 RepID=A0A072PKN6_9EURO|nr:uncharacterized protein A1O9_04746 [Exophiala aquamarina CBS 119918]KEF59898.1 hypothetical protein A1O9_04746 [Exophiala aquamarina CBS 119918]
MAEAQSIKEHSCHLLNFFYDECNSCALTPFINGVRFHLIVDPDELKSPKNKPILPSYLDLLGAVKTEGGKADIAAAKGFEDAQATTAAPQQARTTGTKIQQDSDSAIDLRADQEKSSDEDARNKHVDAATDLQN